nr:hypothetical protein [Escherichia coli]
MNKTKGCLIANFATVPKFFIRFIKMKITRQLKFIGFASEPAITLNLLSGQKINGHIGLPA